jgi:putative DNA primase/helicase
MADKRHLQLVDENQLPPEGEFEACPPEFSDEELALRYEAEFGIDLRYVAAWNKWFHWHGNRWIEDDELLVYTFARKLCREAAAEAADDKATEKYAKAVASSATVNAVVSLARAAVQIAANVDQWDADPWQLNTPQGVVDLKGDGICQIRPRDYHTKSTAVAPSNDGCPLWLGFLDRITGGDRDLQTFLQRMAGYCLTGSTQEHALFFLYGTGANGKTVFLNTLLRILDSYARTAAIETFTETHNERHPTDLAMLRGARLVSATETEQGRRWSEAKIKALTGGDRIVARFMRQDFFEYTPQFKLVIAGNHKPGLRAVDEAIRRRLHLIPFNVTIPPDERDSKLAEKLEAEWPGILQWMIDGCHMWLEQGLAPPEIVRVATDDYLEAEDTLSAWLDERCEIDPQAWTPRAELWASWKDYATRTGEYVGSQKALTQNLERHGFRYHRQGSARTRGFCGLRLTLKEAAFCQEN